jgi:hypothetical protein
VRIYAVLFAIGLVVYGALAGERLFKQSGAPHFMLQADAWLHGQVHVDPPLSADDWATIETVALDDGTVVRGRRMVTKPLFHTTGGEDLPTKRIAQSRGYTAYVSFPPFPSVLMLPSALIAGRGASDVLVTVFVAALILPLCFLMLRKLAAAGHSQRTVRDDLWLTGTLAFGSVLFFSAVRGEVWYTAHVVGVVLALLYAWASIDAEHPLVAGLALGAAALTRTSMAFMLPLFLYELWRTRNDRRWQRLAWFVAPIVAFAIAGMIYNHVRFGAPTEFGHSFLALGNHQPVRQQYEIEKWGLAGPHYLMRNLAVAFLQLPEPHTNAMINGHGLALWFTTPLLFLLVWPKRRGGLHVALWVTVVLVALPSITYMNSGWFQFGYRFSLDYMVFLIMLLAIGGRPLGRVAQGLIVFGVIVNLFGAYTFGRKWQYYGRDYDHIHVLGGVTTVAN